MPNETTPTPTEAPAAAEAPKIYCAYTALVPLVDLKPHPQNPKSHPIEQIEAFKEIVKVNGIRRPITVSKRSGFVVAGHGLLQTLELLGVHDAPVDFQDFKDEAHELAHLAADNKLAEYGVVNEAQLKSVVKQIEAHGLDKALAGILDELDVVLAEDDTAESCTYPLQPEFDEGYDAVLIFTRTETEFAQLATVLGLPRTMNRKGNIGVTRVVHWKQFLEKWTSRSSFPVTAEQAVLQPTAQSPTP